MSTYYYGTIIRTSKDKGVEVLAKDIDCNFIKNVMFGWDIEGEKVYPSDDVEKAAKESTMFLHREYMGVVLKDTLHTVSHGMTFSIETPTHKADCTGVIIHSNVKTEVDILKNLKDNNLFIDLSMDEAHDISKNKDNYFYIYYEHPFYRKGSFYTSTSFKDVEQMCISKLKEIQAKSLEWEALRKSVEYLKLSSEEKEHIWETYEYEITDEDHFYEYRLDAVQKIRHVCELFDGWYSDEKVYFYIYSDTSEYNEEPDWVYERS